MLNDDNDYCIWRYDSLRLLGFLKSQNKRFNWVDINLHRENGDRRERSFRNLISCFKSAEGMKVENLGI